MSVGTTEIHPGQRKRTLPYYVVLFGLVAPLWSVIPASWAFVIYALRTGRIWTFSWRGNVAFVVALCEVFFSVYWLNMTFVVKRPAPCGPGEPLEIQTAFRRLLKAGLADLPENGLDLESDRPGSPEEIISQLAEDDPRAVDFRNCLRNWFRKAEWSSIRLREVEQWIYWSIFNADMPSPEHLSEAHRSLLDWALELLEKRCGCKIPTGTNPSVVPVRLTIDPVTLLWRPLSFYLFVYSVNHLIKYWYTTSWRVSFATHGRLEYFTRMPKHWNPATGPRPIVFIHGLGLGLLQYNSTLTHLFKTFPDRPLLVLLQPQISQRIFHPDYLNPLSRQQAAELLAQLIIKLGWAKDVNASSDSEVASSAEDKEFASPRPRNHGVTMMSHSNGTYVHAWMLKDHPTLIRRSCLIDPVTFCGWEGDVCYNFVYRPCRTGMEMLMKYFVGAEIGVANLLQRHFDWTSNSLFFEEIPNARDPSKSLFVMGGNDAILHAARVKRYLTSHGVKKGILYDPHGAHGQALLPGTHAHNEIFRWLKDD